MGAPDHYFTAEPASPDERRRLPVRLAGVDVEVETARGVFSPDRLDPGTAVLLREAPDPPDGGDLLDLGCGWGPLALAMARLAPSATVWAVDVNARARDLARRNADALGLRGVRVAAPEDVPAEVRFAALWSNPPIRVGKQELHELLLRWLPRLDDGASGWLVVKRDLGADSLHRWLSGALPELATTRQGQGKGYRVLRAHRSSR